MNEKTLTEMSDSAFDGLLERFINRIENNAPSLTREERRKQLAEAAQIAAPWYLEDKELTIFTALDGDDILEYTEEMFEPNDANAETSQTTN